MRNKLIAKIREFYHGVDAEKLADDYAYITSGNLDRILWQVKDETQGEEYRNKYEFEIAQLIFDEKNYWDFGVVNVFELVDEFTNDFFAEFGIDNEEIKGILWEMGFAIDGDNTIGDGEAAELAVGEGYVWFPVQELWINKNQSDLDKDAFDWLRQNHLLAYEFKAGDLVMVVGEDRDEYRTWVNRVMTVTEMRKEDGNQWVFGKDEHDFTWYGYCDRLELLISKK